MKKFLAISVLILLPISCSKNDKFDDFEYIITYGLPLDPYSERIDHFFTALSGKEKLKKKEEELLIYFLLHEILWEQFPRALYHSEKISDKCMNPDFVSFYIYIKAKEGTYLPTQYVKKIKERSWKHDIVYDKELIIQGERRPWIPWLIFFEENGDSYVIKNEIDINEMLELRVNFAEDFGIWDRANWYNLILQRYIHSSEELRILYSNFIRNEFHMEDFEVEPIKVERVPEFYRNKLRTHIDFYMKSIDLGDELFTLELKKNIQETVQVIEKTSNMSLFESNLLEKMESYNKAFNGILKS